MEVADLLAVRDAGDLVDRPVVAGLQVLGVLHDLVDEVAEVEHEAELVGGRRPLVLEDHPAIGVERALVDALAADEREVHRPRIVGRAGAVMVRPMRLPLPSASVKRYQ